MDTTKKTKRTFYIYTETKGYNPDKFRKNLHSMLDKIGMNFERREHGSGFDFSSNTYDITFGVKSKKEGEKVLKIIKKKYPKSGLESYKH